MSNICVVRTSSSAHISRHAEADAFIPPECPGEMQWPESRPPPPPPRRPALLPTTLSCVQGLQASMQLLGVAGSSAARSMLTAGSGMSIDRGYDHSSMAVSNCWHSCQTQPPAGSNGHFQREGCSSESNRWPCCSDAGTGARTSISPSRGLLHQLWVSASKSMGAPLSALDPSQPNMRHISTAAGTAPRDRALASAQENVTSAAAAICAAQPHCMQRRGYAVSGKGHQPSAALREIGNQQLRSFVESPGMLAEPYTCGDIPRGPLYARVNASSF